MQEVGKVRFGIQPVNATDSDLNNYIQLTGEDGTVTKWFARSTGTNGAQLTGGNWPGTGAYQYNIAGTYGLTAREFSTAVNGYNAGFAGSAAQPVTGTETYVGGNVTQDVILTAALTGSTPDRVGLTSAAFAVGSSFYSNNGDPAASNTNFIEPVTFAGGVNEDIQGETGTDDDGDINYITIVDSASNTKHYFPSHDATNQATGSTGTRTKEDDSTVSVTYFQWASNGSNTDCASALSAAINHANGHPSTITASPSSATVNLSHDITGAAGNAATLVRNEVGDSAATISGANFTGGVTEVNGTSTPYIQIINAAGTPITKKYVPVKNGDALGNGNNGGGSIGDVSGGIAFQEGASATATATNLELAIEHTNGHDGSITVSRSSGVLTLTQATTGTAGNTTITLSNTSKTTRSSFTGGANITTPNAYISITNAAGVNRKYHASTTEATGSTDGTYIYFQNGGDTDASAANLKTAIEDGDGHDGSLTVSRADNVLTVNTTTNGGQGASALNNISSGVTLGSWSAQSNQISVGANEASEIGTGNKIYDSSTTLIGTVSSSSNSVITLAENPATTVTSTIYTNQLREAMYLEQMFKVSLVFLKAGSVELWLNDELIKKDNHTLNSVTLHPSDCKIGKGADATEQFYGELYEIAMHKGKRPGSTLKTLTPSYSDILFYYTFGD